MADYKQTLNLPQTDFPMRGNLPKREPERLARWQERDLFRRMQEVQQGRPKYVLHDGPPYANGTIHIGHAVNKVLKDVINKARALDGYHVTYVPGWDCHGLPIEHQVEKTLGRVGDKVDARTFRQACRDFAAEQVDGQREDFQRLGVLGDWQHPYLTMDFATEADIIRALGRVYANGHIVRGYKPVHWCTDCHSALAEAEVEYADKRSPAIDVRFPAVDGEALLARMEAVEGGGSGPVSVVIWTTTPWTLPANEAVALHPELDYVLVEGGGERLLLAEALWQDVLTRAGVADGRVVARGRGAALEGLRVRHPFHDRDVPVILGDHVTLEAGTGAVHTAPGHGLEDYIVGQQYGLPVDHPVGDDGRFLPDTELFAGLHVFAANDRVVEVLSERGNLLHVAPLEHSYPHCWRHKTPIIFRATPQWFISMDGRDLRAQALKSITEVDWHPEWGEARIDGMVRNRPDWCISRQRSWGIPITLFVHVQTGEPHPRTLELLEQVAQRVERGGIDAWFDLDPGELLGDEAADYRKVDDTMDVWFDSGTTHFSVLERRPDLNFPADLYLEGSDQHRGWFQSSLLASVAMHGVAPYKAVLTHGFTVDAQGRKMSKSLGNVVAPQEVMNRLGADILRLWVAATDYRNEMSVSDEILKRMADAYRRIRNTARFLLANLAGFDPARDAVAPADMVELDRWALQRARDLQADIVRAYQTFEFHQIYQKVHNFCSVDMGAFYLDIIKDRQYTAQADGLPRRSAQTAMHHIVEALCRWLAPVLSFTADEIWEQIPGARDESVFLATWYDLPVALPEAEVAPFMARWRSLAALRDAVNDHLEAARQAGTIGGSLDAEVTLFARIDGEADRDRHADLAALDDELRFALITSGATLVTLEAVEALPGEAAELAWTDADGAAHRWAIHVARSAHAKCPRCWHHRVDVGTDADHPELCGRCVTNVFGAGEARRHA
ncbi:MAG: isoleucine--tRNA ligase [Gammaproteobacteria bacterium]|nr:isoleucine--tRNA ligase [Gammaproteobacteria bacterium]